MILTLGSLRIKDVRSGTSVVLLDRLTPDLASEKAKREDEEVGISEIAFAAFEFEWSGGVEVLIRLEDLVGAVNGLVEPLPERCRSLANEGPAPNRLQKKR